MTRSVTGWPSPSPTTISTTSPTPTSTSRSPTGWWEEHDRTERRILFTLHGRTGAHRYALIRTDRDWLVHRTVDQPDGPA